jgi:hypothetical protein
LPEEVAGLVEFLLEGRGSGQLRHF